MKKSATSIGWGTVKKAVNSDRAAVAQAFPRAVLEKPTFIVQYSVPIDKLLTRKWDEQRRRSPHLRDDKDKMGRGRARKYADKNME